jgi:hypothetical protein
VAARRHRARHRLHRQGVDVNGDGAFDLLEVTGTLTVDRRATQLTDFQTVRILDAGTGPLTLNSDGRSIGESGFDGPFQVLDLSV